MEAYKAYLHEISGFIPDERIYTDDLRLLPGAQMPDFTG